MKLSTFFENLNSKVDDFEISTELHNELLTKFSEQEIPDDYANILTKFISKKEAYIDKDIAQHHQQKVYSNLTKAQTNRLLAQNFTDDEISLINQLSVEDRIEKILELQKTKITSLYSQNESDKIKHYEALVNNEKERVEKFQQTLLQKEQEVGKIEERIRNEYMLNSMLDDVKYRTDTVPRATAKKILKTELEAYLSQRGAKLIFINDTPKIVHRDDETEEFYDENNKSIRLNNLIVRIAQSQNLVDNKVIEKVNSDKPAKSITNFDSKKTDTNDYYKKFMNNFLKRS